MFPWFLIWAPNLHFPWSGSVAQQIDPSTTWFFDSVNAQDGNGAVEKQAVQIASYGRQLGLITDVLLELADQQDPLPEEAAIALTKLKAIRTRIETLKSKQAEAQLQELESSMRALQSRDPDSFAALLARVAPLPQVQ
jgi:hypothetical protein